MKKFLIFVSAFVLSASAFIAQAQMQQLPNDPAVKVGKLENGLTYYIRHNDKPAGRAEFYLATNVGAIQETPDQDGLAHFLEHMCFNGTKNFPEKGILNWLQSIGASFGGNVNAATGIDQTTYMLNNIPLVRESVVDTCLLILHDYSHFVTNDPAEIDKERPVIIEERRSRRNAGWRTFEKSLPYLYGDTKYATCTLIGSKENLETFKPESLVNFYQTWYRPDLQAVIVVGDIDVDAVEGKIKSIFADIPAAVNPKPKEKILFKEFTEPRVAVITDPETTSASVEMVWESAARDEALNSTPVGLMTDLIESVVQTVMSERFNDITSSADAPYLYGSFGFGKLCEAIEGTDANVALKEDNILGGFKAFVTEVERLKRYGLTEGEVTRAKDNILAAYEKAANGADTRKNGEFVNPLINHFFSNYSFMEPATRLELVKTIFSQINATVMNQILAQGFADENSLVVVYSGPEKEGIATPTAGQLLQVIDEVKKAEIEAPAADAVTEPLMDPSTLKGGNVKKTSKTVYGATEWILSNGAKVVVLPTDHKKDQILFSFYKAGGQSLIPTEDLASFDASIFGAFQSVQGLSKFKGTDLTKVLSGKMVSVSPFIDNLYNGVSGNSSVKDLETAFQLLYLNYVDPRFDQKEFDNATSQIKAVLPNLLNTPNFAFQKELNKVLYNDDPRNEVISMEKLEKASLQAIERNYRRLFADVAGSVMVIVGDVDLDTLKPLVEKYVGSLPKGKKATKWADVEPKLAKGKVVDVFDQKMETPLSTVLQVYSDYRPFSVKDQTLASAVSYILDQIYTDTLREDEGGTYGASSSASARKYPDGRYLLQVYFNSKPALAEKLRTLAQDGFRKLAEEGPTDEQFTRTVENFKKNVPESRINNSYWLSNILRYFRNGYDYDQEWEAAVNGLTKEGIREAAARLYNSGNFIEVVMMPGETAEAE